MDWDTVEVKALFTMLPKEESKQENPVTSKLRPNHNFYGRENINMCFGEVTVTGDEWIYPGESKVVFIKFGLLPEYKKKIKIGFKWRIQAASQHFANGEILEILSP